MNEATDKVLEILRRPSGKLSPKEMAQDLATENWQRKQGDAKRTWQTRAEDGKKIKDSPKDKKRSLIGEDSVEEGVQRRTSQAIYDRLGLKSKNIDFELFHRGVNAEKKDKIKTKGDLDKAAHEAERNLSEKPDKYKKKSKEEMEEGRSYGALIRDTVEKKKQNPEDYCKHPRCLWKIHNTHKGDNPCRRHPEFADKPEVKEETDIRTGKEVKHYEIHKRVYKNGSLVPGESTVVGHAKTRKAAIRSVDRRDAEHGGYAHFHKPVFNEEVEILQLDEKIHPGADWHKNDPDELMDHIYWLHGKKAPKDLKIRSKAYQGLVKQLHASNPAPHKKALDRHMNHHINQAKKKLVEGLETLDERNMENKAKKNDAIRKMGRDQLIKDASSYRKKGSKLGAARAFLGARSKRGSLRAGRSMVQANEQLEEGNQTKLRVSGNKEKVLKGYDSKDKKNSNKFRRAQQSRTHSRLKEAFDLLEGGNKFNKQLKNKVIKNIGSETMADVAKGRREQGNYMMPKDRRTASDRTRLKVGRYRVRFEEAFEQIDESVVSAANAHREPVNQSLKWEMQKRKDKRREQMASIMKDAKAEYEKATAPKPKSKAKMLAASDMKKKPVTEGRDADERAGDREDRRLKRDVKSYAKDGKKPRGLKDVWDLQHPKVSDMHKKNQAEH